MAVRMAAARHGCHTADLETYVQRFGSVSTWRGDDGTEQQELGVGGAE